MLEKENQCLKNEIKNQPVVVEILITNDKFANEWKTVKTKFKDITNIETPSSVSPKNPSPANLQNRFDNVITEVNQIEIHKLQNHTTTNHHKRCEITNTQSKSRVEKNSHNIRPSNVITANEINTQSKNLIRNLSGNHTSALWSLVKKHVSWVIVI